MFAKNRIASTFDIARNFHAKNLNRCSVLFFSTSANKIDSNENSRKKNFWLRLSGYYGSSSTRIRNSEAMYRTCTEAASRKTWHTNCMIGYDWKSKLLLRTLYVWLVNKRLVQEGKPFKKHQQVFFNEFWGDTRVHIRNAGVDELLNDKNLKIAQQCR